MARGIYSPRSYVEEQRQGCPASCGPCGMRCCCQQHQDQPPIDWPDDPSLPGPYRWQWTPYYAAMRERWACWSARQTKPPARLSPDWGGPVGDMASDKWCQDKTPPTVVKAHSKDQLRKYVQSWPSTDTDRQRLREEVNRCGIMRRCEGCTEHGPDPLPQLSDAQDQAQGQSVYESKQPVSDAEQAQSKQVEGEAERARGEQGEGGMDWAGGDGAIVPSTDFSSENGNSDMDR